MKTFKIFSGIVLLFILIVGCSAGEEPEPTAQPPTPEPVQPAIQAIYPDDSALPGTMITLAGEYFGETPGEVTFGDLQANIINWEDKQIDVEVPATIGPGKTQVAIAAGDDTNATSPFTILTADLASLGLRASGYYKPAVADYDGDGDLDMFVPSNASEGGVDNAYFLNNGDGTFSEVSLEDAGLPILADSFSAASADFDQDNDADLYVVGSGQDFYALNKGDGTFVTQNLADAGLEMRPDQNGTEKLGLVAADFDLDGDPDVFVNIGFDIHVDNFYALNNGDGTFSPVDLSAAGIPTGGDGKYVSTADLNGDGAPDLWVGQMDSPAVYLLNNGDGTFTLQDLEASGLSGAGAGSTQAIADYDLDGDLDMFLGDTEPARDFAVLEYFALNNGDGTFTLQDLDEMGLLDPPHQFRPTLAVDFNGDGYADIYQSGSFVPDGFFALNNGDGTFSAIDLQTVGLAVDITLGLPVAFDFDEDGDMDIFNHAMLGKNTGDGTFVTYR